MPGTVENLLRRLGQQVDDLEQACRRIDPTWDALPRSWGLLSRATLRVLDILDSHLPSEPLLPHVRLALAATTHPTGHGRPLPAHWRLTTLTETIGALADLLTTAPLPRGPAAAQAAHVVALSLGGLVGQASRAIGRTIPTTQHAGPFAAALRRIAATAPTGHEHPGTSNLHQWRLAAATDPSLDGALTGWAGTATTVLTDPYRVTGLALQLIAADIALIATASAAILDTTDHDDTVRLLHTAARTWIQAARWPNHLRLGGRTDTLRHASARLRHAIDEPVNTPTSETEEPQHPHALVVMGLHYALQVAQQHTNASRHLAAGRPDVWIATGAIPTEYLNVEQHLTTPHRWIPAPPALQAARPLAIASATATQALQAATQATWDMLATGPIAPHPLWETITPAVPRHDPAPPTWTTTSLTRGTHPSIDA